MTRPGMGVAVAAATIALLGCVGCSQENARVATRLNDSAALTGNLPWNPLGGKVITSWVDRSTATMSTLYGNDVAVGYARTHRESKYPAGAVISSVSWSQQEDPRWFGGNIPSKPAVVEFVTVTAGEAGKPVYAYQRYEGAPLKQATSEESSAPGERAAYLLSQRAAVMP